MNLNCWDYGPDKGGCGNVSGGYPPYTYSWQLAGSGGYLSNSASTCREIIGSGFSGTLYLTVTDSQNNQAWDSCSYLSLGGGPPF